MYKYSRHALGRSAVQCRGVAKRARTSEVLSQEAKVREIDIYNNAYLHVHMNGAGRIRKAYSEQVKTELKIFV